MACVATKVIYEELLFIADGTIFKFSKIAGNSTLTRLDAMHMSKNYLTLMHLFFS